LTPALCGLDAVRVQIAGDLPQTLALSALRTDTNNDVGRNRSRPARAPRRSGLWSNTLGALGGVALELVHRDQPPAKLGLKVSSGAVDNYVWFPT